jgi:predicted permease
MLTFLRGVAHTLRGLVRRNEVEADLDEEMRFHLEMEIALNVKQGMSAGDARRAALLSFGGVQRYKEQHRTERGTRTIERLAQDVRYGARRLRRDPGFTLPMVGALGVGIGATVAVLILVDAVILRPLPYPDADRLVVVGHRAPADGAVEGGQSDMTYLHYIASNRSFDAFGLYIDRDLSITDRENPDRVIGALITSGVFDALGVPAMMGTYCPAGLQEPGSDARVVLSDALWRSRYASDPAIIGRRIAINRVARVIAGVMPPSFHFPRLETQLWFCTTVDPSNPNSTTYWRGIARLKPGVTTSAAEMHLTRSMGNLAEAFPRAGREMRQTGQSRPVVTPLRDATIRDVRPALVLLACTAAFVLLIAWANAVNLVLVRSERQQRQIAIERALGATKGDVAQRHLCEAVLLATGAGLIAWLIARFAIAARFGFTSGELPRLHELHPDARLVVLTISLAAITAALLGGAAFARTYGTAVLGALRGAVGRGRAGPEWRRTQRSLVILQVALALTLLIASGIMVQSYQRLSRFDLGFDPTSMLTIEVPLHARGYGPYEHAARFHDEALRRIRTLPGVVSAEVADSRIPLMPRYRYGDAPVAVADRGDGRDPIQIAATAGIATPGWFEAMRIPMRHGRTFRAGDLVSESHPVVVSRAVARALYGSESAALGRRLQFGRPATLFTHTIVGIVGDVPGDRIPDGPARAVYFPILRDLASTPESPPPPGAVPFFPQEVTYFVRSAADPAALVAPIRRIVSELDPQIPVTNPRLLADVVRGSTARARLTMLLLLAGSSVALLLGVIGIYGVVSYSVSLRTPEIGIRMAVGATPASVHRLVMREGAGMTMVGVIGGVLASFLVTRLIRGLLFGVSPTDPATMVAMVALLSAIALAASYLPARRAARIDPVQALRAE